MLSRLIGVFMPYNAMYLHARFVLNESKSMKEEMEVINEWKAARLEELNFVGIVVRLCPHLLNSSHFSPAGHSLDMAFTYNHTGCPPRLCHHLNPDGICCPLLAYPSPVSLSPDFGSHLYLHRHTTDDYPHADVLRQTLCQKVSTRSYKIRAPSTRCHQLCTRRGGNQGRSQRKIIYERWIRH